MDELFIECICTVGQHQTLEEHLAKQFNVSVDRIVIHESWFDINFLGWHVKSMTVLPA